jgi:lysyl-tRNA synthetase class 2
MKTATGQVSVLALEVPQIVAPCLHHIPEAVDNAETLARRPHIHALTSEEPGDVLRLRALIYDYIRTYFISSGFLEVETPTFDLNAGGAIARPFETVANEMSNTAIRLRIAPELNLKRLIIGGQDKIFEIGRAFRNEGVDNTHNPEFSTCEFYEVGATLPDVIARTEQLVYGLHTAVEALRSTYFPTLEAPETDFSAPFAQLPFIPTIEEASGRKLPDLLSPNASNEILDMILTYLFHPTQLSRASSTLLPSNTSSRFASNQPLSPTILKLSHLFPSRTWTLPSHNVLPRVSSSSSTAANM